MNLAIMLSVIFGSLFAYCIYKTRVWHKTTTLLWEFLPSHWQRSPLCYAPTPRKAIIAARRKDLRTLFILAVLLMIPILLSTSRIIYVSGKFCLAQKWDLPGAWLEKQSARLGYSNAQYLLALCYTNGQGIPKDNFEAIRWLTEAVKNGNVDAECELGMRYLDGIGIPSDSKKAYELFFKSAQKGNMFSKGMILWGGYKIAVDKQMAANCFESAMRNGYAPARKKLIDLYCSNVIAFMRCDYSIDEECLDVFRAAKKGDNKAQVEAAKYCIGIAPKINSRVSESMRWYLKAAELDSTFAKGMVELFFADGQAMDAEDMERKATEWLAEAAYQNNEEAMVGLGYCYYPESVRNSGTKHGL
jgi:TPR repeat protein